MTEIDFESAQIELLTDALRAGPGTPLWREAVASLKATQGADEYKLLYAARERLASGRAYREVRPGPGFTRKVFEAIDDEGTASSWPTPSANLIAALSAVVILGILAIVAFIVMPRADQPGEDLSQTYFVTTKAQSTFENSLGTDWKSFGPLNVEAKSGLRPITTDSSPASTFRGGGAIFDRELPSAEPVAVEASIRLGALSEDLVMQVFVTDTPAFSADSATSPHELVFSARGSEASVVLPDGAVEPTKTKLRAGKPVEVRIALNRDQASIEMNGQKLWTGPHQLDTAKPRVIGVRFLARGAISEKDAPVVESVRVLTPQK